MKIRSLFLILVVMVLISHRCKASDALFDVGLGIFQSGVSQPAETKFGAGGIQEDMWGPIKSRYTLGGWIDNTGNGRKSSAFVAAQLGFEVDNNGWIASIYSGPSLLSQTDCYLAGTFEFYNSINFGMQDKFNNYIGIMYRHLSSAGFSMPNIGRDVMGLEIKFPF